MWTTSTGGEEGVYSRHTTLKEASMGWGGKQAGDSDDKNINQFIQIGEQQST